MKKIIKSIVTSFLVFWLAACSNTDKAEIIPDRFNSFMNTYFYGYIYEYKDINARGNHNYGEQYALIKIKKADLNRDEMKNIYKKLEDGGWKLVETNHDNYVNFCYGEDFSLIILYPLGKFAKTPAGIPSSYDDINFWQISVYKSTSKLAACNKN